MVLVEAKADVTACTLAGESAAHWAARNHHNAVASYLQGDGIPVRVVVLGPTGFEYEVVLLSLIHI